MIEWWWSDGERKQKGQYSLMVRARAPRVMSVYLRPFHTTSSILSRTRKNSTNASCGVCSQVVIVVVDWWCVWHNDWLVPLGSGDFRFEF